MRKRETRKRKPSEHKHSPSPAKSIKKTTVINLTLPDPYPTHIRPTPEECRAVRDDLLAFHGFPQQFAKYRQQRLNLLSISDEDKSTSPAPATESVLDGLVSTILSQNTTDSNSQKAFISLKSAFPNWEDVSYLKTLI